MLDALVALAAVTGSDVLPRASAADEGRPDAAAAVELAGLDMGEAVDEPIGAAVDREGGDIAAEVVVVSGTLDAAGAVARCSDVACASELAAVVPGTALEEPDDAVDVLGAFVVPPTCTVVSVLAPAADEGAGWIDVDGGGGGRRGWPR